MSLGTAPGAVLVRSVPREPSVPPGQIPGPAARPVPGQVRGPAGRRGALSLLALARDSVSRVIRLRRGEVAYRSYGVADREPGIYFIEQGFVKSVVASREGKEALLGIFTVGDIVGDLGLRSDCRSESVVAMTATRLRRMSSARLMASLDNENLREEFICYLAGRVQQQQRLITDFVTADSEYRLAAVLIHLADKIGQPRGPLAVITVRITHEELSAMVGTTRSRVGLFLRRFADRGAVVRGRAGTLAVHVERMEKVMNALLAARDERFSARSRGPETDTATHG